MKKHTQESCWRAPKTSRPALNLPDVVLAGKAAVIAPKLDIPAPGPRAHSPSSVNARGKAAFKQKKLAEKEQLEVE